MVPCKSCTQCGEYKPLTEYYRKSSTRDGLRYECKVCKKAANAKWIRENKEEHARRSASWRKSNPKAAAEKSRRWQKAHPEKFTAQRAVTAAINSGRLVRWPCEVCGNSRSQGHHADYSNHLGVTWLCSKHHMQIHSDYKNGVI